MTARTLLAATFAVLGVYYAGLAVTQLAMQLVLGGHETGLMLSTIPGLVLGALFLLCRRFLADRLAPAAEGEHASPTASQLQLVGITLLGLWFAASGVIELVANVLDTSLEQDEYRSGHTFLRRNAGALVMTAIGFVLMTTTDRIQRWLVRRQT
jgi:hypothetical protein